MGAAFSAEAEKASQADLNAAAAGLSADELAKVKAALEAVKTPWKIEAAPDGGMVLCGHPGSGNVIGMMLFGAKYLKEKYKFQMCDIMKGEQMSPDFLAMNPFHQVPSAKMADGTNLYESSAALRYLALKFAPEAYPEASQLKIDIFMDKRQTDFYKAWSPIGYYAMQIAPKPAEDAAKKLNAILNTLAANFLTGKFVAGDVLSIADYSILPLINTLTLATTKKVGYVLPERWVKYLADAKADLGDIWTQSVQVHEGWVGSNEGAVEAVTFEADAPADVASGEWKIDAVPEGGFLLCGHPGSGNVIAPMLFCLKHVKDKYKFQMCDIMKGEQMGADFLAMNPFHQVPSGKMADGTNMYESGAMLRYLALKFAPETYPAEKRLMIDMCLDKRQTDLYKLWGVIGYWAMQIGAAPEKDSAKKLNDVLDTMAKAFLTGKFVGGDTLCIADYSLLPLINTLQLPVTKKMGYVLPERWAKYLADAKADMGAIFTEATAVHEGWVSGNEAKMEKIAFD